MGPQGDQGGTSLSPLNIEQQNSAAAAAEDRENGDDDEVNLERQILDVIDTCPNREIRPGRLAHELGLSIEEASAELSYLLAAVGGGYEGATFRFEDATATTTAAATAVTTKTMVFTFPADFRRRLAHRQRQEDWQRILHETVRVAVKILKIVTAFGLILSLLIVSVAAVISLIGAIVALTRVDGGHRHRSLLMHQIRSIVFTMREILWLYAVFGPATDDIGNSSSGGGGGDPFFKEVAYDLFLFFSICCGNPGSIFYWIRANQWRSRRRQQQQQRRGLMFQNSSSRRRDTFASDIPGVTLISNNNRWDDDDDGENTTAMLSSSSPHQHQQQRGFLSVVVEFLFGPTPFAPGPTSQQIGLLRATVLSKLSFEQSPAITLEQLAPYVDHPPTTLDDVPTIVQQGLLIVSYFHGVPSPNAKNSTMDISSSSSSSSSPTKASFCFPELCAESAISLPRHYSRRKKQQQQSDNGIGLLAMLYDVPDESSSSDRSNHRAPRPTSSSDHEEEDDVPSFLVEDLYRLTRLTPKQFYQCCGLGTLNLAGVVWLRLSFRSFLSTTTMNKKPPLSWLVYAVDQILLPLLIFYALLFFALPLGRLVCVVIWNQYRVQRNRRRQSLSRQLLMQWSQQLESSETKTTTATAMTTAVLSTATI
jgi:hypothetical protein